MEPFGVKSVTFNETKKTAADREILPMDPSSNFLRAQNSSVRLSKEWSVIDTVPEIHEKNVVALKAAYRHPFEYISPVLYRKTTTAHGAKSAFTTNSLFVENEEEFKS